jgi:hypothetical protein
MDKGIRQSANAKFMELLPTRTEVGNTVFRKNVMFYLMDEFSCTNQAAATHYNHSFQKCKKENPALVEGLGRPEGKNNGGRKKKVVVDAATPDVAIAAEVTPEVTELVTEQVLFNVYKKKDHSLVLLGVTKAEAEAAVAKAITGKKAVLVIE